jgi:hypothetical protein
LSKIVLWKIREARPGRGRSWAMMQLLLWEAMRLGWPYMIVSTWGKGLGPSLNVGCLFAWGKTIPLCQWGIQLWAVSWPTLPVPRGICRPQPSREALGTTLLQGSISVCLTELQSQSCCCLPLSPRHPHSSMLFSFFLEHVANSFKLLRHLHTSCNLLSVLSFLFSLEFSKHNSWFWFPNSLPSLSLWVMCFSLEAF